MLIIDRYIIKKGLPPFFYCIASFLLLIVVIDLFENLDTILKNKISLEITARYYLYLVPSFIGEASPLAALMGSIFAFHNLSRFNELTALKATGTHLYRIILPFFFFGLIVSFGNIIINETLIPKSVFQWTMLKEKYFKDHSNKINHYIKKDVAIKSFNNSYLIKEYDVENKEMSGVTILQYNDDQKLLRRINAEKSKWTGVGWIFYHGVIYNYDQEDQNKSVVVNFSEKFLQIPEKPYTFEKSFEVNMMTVKELKKHIQNKKDNGYPIQKEQVALYTRLSVPFASLVVLMVGIPLMLMGNRASIMKGIIFSIIVTFVYKTAMVIGLSLGNGGALSPFWAAWIVNFIFITCGLGLIFRIKT